jgi:hypothetical protein
MARRMALSFFQNPALDRKSDLRAVLICICFISSLITAKECRLDSRLYGIFGMVYFLSINEHER